MAWRAPQITDDHGRRVALFKPDAGVAKDDPELYSTLARVYESASLLHERVRPMHLLYLLIGVGLALLPAFGASMFPGTAPWLVGILAGLGWVPAFLLIRGGTQRRYSHRIMESLLRIGRCPMCGYRLEGAPVDAQGVLVCPECASAWLKSRVGHVPVPAADIPARATEPGDSPPASWKWRNLWVRLPTIVDHRDRSMSLTDPKLPGLEERIGAARAAEVRYQLREGLGLRKLGWGCLAVLAVLIGIAPQIGMFFTAGFFRVPIIAFYMLVFWPLVGVRLVWRIVSGRSRVLAKPTMNILLGQRICPSCAADLAKLPPESDGCVVCAGCSAAWRTEAAIADRA